MNADAVFTPGHVYTHKTNGKEGYYVGPHPVTPGMHVFARVGTAGAFCAFAVSMEPKA